MLNIFRKEVSTFFNSLIGYIVIGVFLLISSLILWIYPDTNILDYGYAEMDSFFSFCPYIFLFLIPAITMRMFSEEVKSGTLELLFTKPISIYNIIFGKFWASLFIVILALIPTLVYYFSIYKLGNPEGNIDTASVLGSYIGLLFLASAFCAIGIFTSTLSKNQVVSFIVGALLCYFFYDGFSQISNLFSGSMQYYLNFFSVSYHYTSLSKGLLDSRNVVYLISITVLFLIFTKFVLDKNRQ